MNLTDRMNKAFDAYCIKYNLLYKGNRELDLNKKDIGIPTFEFPRKIKIRGRWFWSNYIRKKDANLKDVAFRTELRKANKNQTGYLAIIWESMGKGPNKLKVRYATNNENYTKQTMDKISWVTQF